MMTEAGSDGGAVVGSGDPLGGPNLAMDTGWDGRTVRVTIMVTPLPRPASPGFGTVIGEPPVNLHRGPVG